MKKITFILFFAILFVRWGALRSEENKSAGPADVKKMSLDQIMAKAEELLKGMNETIKNGFEMIKDARSKQDLQRLNCLNESMESLKGLLRISEQNMMDLQDRVVSKDKVGAEHEFVKIQIASGKIKEIDTQLKACGGPTAEGIFEVEPIIEKDFDEDLPKDDTALAMEEVIMDIEVPYAASPYY